MPIFGSDNNLVVKLEYGVKVKLIFGKSGDVMVSCNDKYVKFVKAKLLPVKNAMDSKICAYAKLWIAGYDSYWDETFGVECNLIIPISSGQAKASEIDWEIVNSVIF